MQFGESAWYISEAPDGLLWESGQKTSNRSSFCNGCVLNVKRGLGRWSYMNQGWCRGFLSGRVPLYKSKLTENWSSYVWGSALQKILWTFCFEIFQCQQHTDKWMRFLLSGSTGLDWSHWKNFQEMLDSVVSELAGSHVLLQDGKNAQRCWVFERSVGAQFPECLFLTHLFKSNNFVSPKPICPFSTVGENSTISRGHPF